VRIDLTELLREDGNEAEIEQTEKTDFSGDDLKLTAPVQVNLHLVNTGVSVLLSGRAKTEAELECSRCLKSFKTPLSVEFEEEFVKNPFVHRQGEVELKKADFVSPIDQDNSIDLTELVRQELILALPIKTLCSEKCKGV
jgi:uncharacterized protein